MKPSSIVIVALATAIVSGIPAMAAAPPREKLAIVGATVLPMTATDRLEDQTVLVDGDRISAVGPRATVAVPVGYRSIDARGKVLMPGLVDMHVHISPEPGKDWDSTERALALSLANGVTTARIMTGQPAHPQVRAAVEAGTLAGPRLYISAPSRHDGNTPDGATAVAAARKAKADQFDFIKIHGFENVAAWQALADESRKLRIPIAGHVTNKLGLERALAAKQQVEHLDSVPSELMPASASREFGQILSKPELDVLATVPEARFREVAADSKAQGGYFVPTLAAFERITEMTRPFDDMRDGPDDEYVADWIIDQWRARRSGLAEAGFTVADQAGMAAVRRRIVKTFHDAGVPLMAGSDTPHPFQIWGFGLVREIEALHRAGLSPMDALRSSTVVPRDYLRSLPDQGSALGWPANFGTVEKDARADLLLLDRDPTTDLNALKKIDMVVAAGRAYSAAQLKVMLERSAAAGRNQAQPPSQ